MKVIKIKYLEVDGIEEKSQHYIINEYAPYDAIKKEFERKEGKKFISLTFIDYVKELEIL